MNNFNNGPEAPRTNNERGPEKRVLSLEADKAFSVEITGPSNAKTALVLVHGFGVKRDSRGMFTELENKISDRILCARADFSDVSEEATMAVPLSSQTKRVEAVDSYIHDTFHPEETVYIGHSQGCIAIAQTDLKGKKIILLAPPIQSAYENFIRTPGWTRPGSLLNLHGTSTLIRSDGSITKVEPDFWEDFQAVDAKRLYEKLAADNDVEIIFAGADQVLGHEEAPSMIRNSSVLNADHDFRGDTREELFHRIISELVS